MHRCLGVSDGLVEMLCLVLTRASPMDLQLMLLEKAADRNLEAVCSRDLGDSETSHRGEGHTPMVWSTAHLCMELLCRKTAEGLGKLQLAILRVIGEKH